MKIDKKQIKNIIVIVIIIIIIINIIFSIKNFLKPKEAYIFGIKGIIIRNNEMSPELGKYDIIIVKRCDLNDIQIGDIISYYDNNELITSRVVQKQDTGLRTKQDNNENYNYHYVIQSDIIGKEIFKIKIYYIIPIIAIIIILITVIIIKKNKNTREGK